MKLAHRYSSSAQRNFSPFFVFMPLYFLFKSLQETDRQARQVMRRSGVVAIAIAPAQILASRKIFVQKC